MPKCINAKKYNKFKVRISQLIAKIELNQQSLTQIKHCLTVHIQI